MAMEQKEPERLEINGSQLKTGERHPTILEEIEEGYLEADLKGRIYFCNENFCQIIGYTMQEVLNLDFREYMTEDVANVVFAIHNEVFRTGIPHKGFNYEIIRKDGSRRTIENSISLIRDNASHRRGFRSITRDVTERKRIAEELEKHRSRLQAIFESVKDAIILIDSEMRVVEVNKSFENICGIGISKVIGSKFNECPAECNQSCIESIGKALNSMLSFGECQIKCDHNARPQQRVVITSSQLLDSDNDSVGLVVVIRDITRLSNLERELGKRQNFQSIVGKSSKMQDIYNLLDDLTNIDTTVLITGESGTGKSMIAKALHYSGSRAAKPIITVNCSALPENLLESELFGHVRGAFTGAIKDSQGRFQAANSGTILLDEIGDISPRLQLKLLKVLQEKEVERVGESTSIKVDVRVIACTNRNLKEKVNKGEFREDLYYRIKVIELKMPPLRERNEDIPMLVDHFCTCFNKSFNKNIQGVSGEVMRLFMTYQWPGNVRELAHCIEHAFVLCRHDTIHLEHIPSDVREFSGVEKKEKAYSVDNENSEELLKALQKTYWNKAKAARLLGIDRSTLYRKIQKYRLLKTDI